jgi:dienelactone hydrolase
MADAGTALSLRPRLVFFAEAARATCLINREMGDALSALKFLRALPYVDAKDVALVGHSFGGSLTAFMAEREPNLRAVVVFSGAGYSFDRSPELRARLLAAVDHIAAPVFFIHAENDYSLSSGKVLDARRQQIGKPHRLKIYPPIGHTVDDGHWSDNTARPVLAAWPLPPLRPKRAAYGVAGLRSGSGQRDARHALMAKALAGKPQPEAIPLNI